MYKFKILGIPKAKQSASFRIIKTATKSFIGSYQKKEIVENQRNISFDIKSQLPSNFMPLEGALFAKVIFVFPILKSMKKNIISDIKKGGIFYKIAKPDLVDNLMKGLFDAMSGIVFIDDAQICKVSSCKIFGETPMTIVLIGSVEDDNEADAIHIYRLCEKDINN